MEDSGEAAWARVMERLMKPADAELATHYLLHQPIKTVLALQVVYVVRCCEAAMHLASARIVDKFTRTWETRLSAYRALPDGTPRVSDATTSPPQLLIGLIGCGIIGMSVIRTLLDAGIEPSQLLISTRSPKNAQLRELSVRGAWVGFDNRKVAGAVHVLVFATLPSQLPDATQEVHSNISHRTLILSLVGGVPSTKIRSMVDSPYALQLLAGSEQIREALAFQSKTAGLDAPDSASATTNHVDEPLPSSKLASLALRAIISDMKSAHELARLIGSSMLHGQELEEEAEDIGRRALCMDVKESSEEDSPPLDNGTVSHLLSSLDEAVDYGLMDTESGYGSLSEMRRHFMRIARQVLVKNV